MTLMVELDEEVDVDLDEQADITSAKDIIDPITRKYLKKHIRFLFIAIIPLFKLIFATEAFLYFWIFNYYIRKYYIKK